jgi:hypothetical protein
MKTKRLTSKSVKMLGWRSTFTGARVMCIRSMTYADFIIIWNTSTALSEDWEIYRHAKSIYPDII